MDKLEIKSDLEFALDVLVIWANNKGYDVLFEKNGDDAICWVSKSIEINSSVSLKKQVYCLLHECGHVLILENESFWKYPRVRIDDEQKDSKTKIYTLIEEIEAWERAYKLAIRLKIPIVFEEWEFEVIDALKKYVKWAAN